MNITRRKLLSSIALAAGWLAMPQLRLLAAEAKMKVEYIIDNFNPLKKSKEKWRELLPENSYEVLFEEDTERAFSSPLNKEERQGTFICAACNLPLFASETKFDSGTGWPSFYQPLSEKVVGTKHDFILLIPRKEYHCARCGGHQGHIFNDGPEPTGQRWCNNGLALKFILEGEAFPALRT